MLNYIEFRDADFLIPTLRMPAAIVAMKRFLKIKAPVAMEVVTFKVEKNIGLVFNYFDDGIRIKRFTELLRLDDRLEEFFELLIPFAKTRSFIEYEMKGGIYRRVFLNRRKMVVKEGRLVFE